MIINNGSSVLDVNLILSSIIILIIKLLFSYSCPCIFLDLLISQDPFGDSQGDLIRFE